MFEKLTAHQKRFIELAAHGYDNRQIAEQLNYSYTSVAQTFSRIYKLLKIKRGNARAELVCMYFADIMGPAFVRAEEGQKL